MRAMEAVEVVAKGRLVLRLLEKNRESILVTQDGVPQCTMRPASQLDRQMFGLLRRRKAKKK